MSEREEQFILKAEGILQNIQECSESATANLDKVKAWYRNAAVAFAVSIVVFASIFGVVGYRLGAIESTVKNDLATKKSVEFLMNAQTATTSAVRCLVEEKYQEGYDEIRNVKKLMDENIWAFTSDLRGGKE